MLKNLITLTVFLVQTAHAENQYKTIETLQYSGLLAGADVSFRLSYDTEKVFGGYIYDRYGKPIPLNGSISSGRIKLTEKIDDAKKAKIFGVFDEKGALKGEWQGGKVHALELFPESVSYKAIINDIKVTFMEGQRHLINIKFKSGEKQSLIVFSETPFPMIMFEDLNFDGYPDMRVPEFDSMPNASFGYFFYSPSNKKFVRAPEYMLEVTNPTVPYGKKILTGSSRNGCCNYSAIIVGPEIIERAEFDFSTGKGFMSTTSKEARTFIKLPIAEMEFREKFLIFSGESDAN